MTSEELRQIAAEVRCLRDRAYSEGNSSLYDAFYGLADAVVSLAEGLAEERAARERTPIVKRDR